MARKFKMEALLNGIKLPDAGNTGSQDVPCEDLTPEQEAQANAHLKQAIERKIMEKNRG